MSQGYGALRLWSTVLIVVGVVGVVLVVIGMILAMIQARTFGQALAILLIAAPLAALFASWPIALGQGLRAIADVAEYVRGQQNRVR
jgi:protein-S-isoprenylcysteine O-methyltransferase Ste14